MDLFLKDPGSAQAAIAFFSLVVAILSFVAAVAAVLVSAWTACQQNKTAQSQLLVAFLNEYSTDEMSNSVKELSTIKGRDKFLKIISTLASERPNIDDTVTEKAQEVVTNRTLNEARRRVDRYFHNAYILWHEKYIRKETLGCIIQGAGAAYHGLFFEVVTPLTLAVGLIDVHNKNVNSFIESQKGAMAWRNKLKSHFPPKEQEA